MSCVIFTYCITTTLYHNLDLLIHLFRVFKFDILMTKF
jgi:hypothetical protein